MANEAEPLRRVCVERLDPVMAEILAQKTGAERLEIAFGMYLSARKMLESHLAAIHPDWSAEERRAEVARRISHESV